jgi:hypothetical protein
MFGYVVPDKPEMKIKEFELFKAYYCGLCKSIGESCGQIARFALNYDCSFLGMLLSSFRDCPEVIKMENCIESPFRKKHIIRESEILDYAADINIMLAYYKLDDDFRDDKSVKSAAFMGMLGTAFKKAIARNPAKGKIIKERLNELSKIESSDCSSIDEAAEPFAKLTEEIFVYEPICSTGNREKLIRWFGYNIGKWIYTIDGFDDIEKDIKNKSFNPILRQFCYNDEKADEFKNRISENIKFMLVYTLSEAGKAFDLLDIKKNGPILENIIYGGMYNKTLQILNKRSCIKNEKSL